MDEHNTVEGDEGLTRYDPALLHRSLTLTPAYKGLIAILNTYFSNCGIVQGTIQYTLESQSHDICKLCKLGKSIIVLANCGLCDLSLDCLNSDAIH